MKPESARETDRDDIETLVGRLMIRSAADGMRVNAELSPEAGRRSRAERILRETPAMHATTRTTELPGGE